MPAALPISSSPESSMNTPPLCDIDNAELRHRAAAIVAEFGGPLPDATEAGFAEAERRLAGLRNACRRLGKEMPYDFKAENEIIIPTLTAAENALVAFTVLAPSLALLYLAIYVSHRRRQRRAARPQLSLIDVIGRQYRDL